jgi:hypothetical protein
MLWLALDLISIDNARLTPVPPPPLLRVSSRVHTYTFSAARIILEILLY